MRSYNRYISIVTILLLVISICFITRHQELYGRYSQDPIDPYFFWKLSNQNLRETGIDCRLLQNTSSSRTHLIEYLKFPARVEPYNFSNCDLSTCFNLSRCKGSKPLKIHIISNVPEQKSDLNENNIIHRNILEVVRNSEHYEPDIDKACLLILEDDMIDRDPLSHSFLQTSNDLFGPKHNFGMNFIVFNLYSGTWPDYREDDFSGVNTNAAIVVKASASFKYHRRGFDVSLPLFSANHPLESTYVLDDQIPISNRSFFVTFKGKRYVIGKGSETRNSLHHLNNDRDVLLLSTCHHGRKWRESEDKRCKIDEELYNQYDFVQLMKNSTFCLIPRGRRLGTYRFLEALQYGCIPVILSNGWVTPFDELLDWSRASVRFDEELTLLVIDLLRDVSDNQIESMRKYGSILYEKHLSSLNKIVITTIKLIEQRILKSLDQLAESKKPHRINLLT